MKSEATGPEINWILIAQVASISMIWVFVLGIAVWIFNLLRLSIQLNDAPGASVGISLIAIPVFVTLAGVLTYVFIGLQREARRLRSESHED